MKKVFLFLIALSSFHAYSNQMYFAKVLRVDSNNVIHIGKNGLYSAINLAYLMTPVKGEPYHDVVNQYLTEKLVGEWVRVTEVSYGRGALVKPSLIRLHDSTMLNSEILRKGLAFPDMNTMPPPAIVNLATNAREQNIGVWTVAKEFAHARYLKHGQAGAGIFGNMLNALTKAKEQNIQPYLLDDKTMGAYPLKCLNAITKPELVSTEHVATHRGYTIRESCPDQLDN